MSARSKHEEISRDLRTEIATGKLGPRGRLPSESQLVKRYGVSRPTVARALRDLMSEGLIERRAGSGTYARERAAAAVSARLLGLLIPGLLTTEIFSAICGELAKLARVHDYSLLWGTSHFPFGDTDGSLEHTGDVCRQFIQCKVSGVFFAPMEHTPEHEGGNRRVAEVLRESGIPVVLLDRDMSPFPARSDFDLVGMDNFAAGYMLAEHLIKLGRRRLGLVARPLSAPTVNARFAGAREAGLAHHPGVTVNPPAYGDAADIKFVKSLAAGHDVDAIICANDHTAVTLIQTLGKLGVGVPKHVSVVGFDDVKYATLLAVPLTTIQQPCREIAEVAFRAMLERINEPTIAARTIALTPRLTVRESCGAYLPHRNR
jgi:DNA-binding LacI/PurR family transcriptional regulator